MPTEETITPASDESTEPTVEEIPTPAPTPLTLPKPPAAPEPVVEVKKDEVEEPTFTASDVERMIQGRVARLNKSHEKEIASLRESLGGPDLSAAQADIAALRNENAALRTEFAVKFAAVSQGVPADQVEAIVKLADLSGVMTEGAIDQEKVDAAVQAVVARFPGLVAKPVETQGSSAGVGGGPSTVDPKTPEHESLMDAVIARYNR